MKKEKDIYQFDSEKHIHTLNGKRLTGCTTVLNVVAKPFLIPWAANMTAGFLKNKLKDVKELNQDEWEILLDEARKAHTKKKEKAGSYGTKTHEAISKIIQLAIDESDGVIGEVLTEDKSIQNFVDWAVKNNVRFLETEKNVYSGKWHFAGICDMIIEIDNRIWIADIKTAKSGIYSENFWQVSGYHILLEDMGLYPNVKGYLILNLKENGEVNEKRSISIEENKQAFFSCLNIYRTLEKIKKNIL